MESEDENYALIAGNGKRSKGGKINNKKPEDLGQWTRVVAMSGQGLQYTNISSINDT